MLPRPPKVILVLCLLISLAAMITAIAAGGLAILEITRTPKINQYWFLAAFNILILIASGFGITAGLGRFLTAPALAMVCAGGPMIVGAMLGEPALSARLLGQPVDPTVLSGVQIKYIALTQLGCGITMMLLASLTVFARAPGRSYPYAARFALSMVPVVGLTIMVRKAPSIFGAMPTWARVGVNLIALLGVIIFLSLAAHCLIRAYESGRPEEYDPAANPKPEPRKA